MLKIFWIIVFTTALSFSQNSGWVVYNTDNSPLPGNSVGRIRQDSVGNFWIGTPIGGLARFDGTNWEIFNKQSHGFQQNYIVDFDFDKYGRIWMATGHGVTMFDYSSNEVEIWEIYDNNTGGWPSERICVDHEENKWTSINHDLVRLKDSTITAVTDMKHRFIDAIYYDDNAHEIWIGASFLDVGSPAAGVFRQIGTDDQGLPIFKDITQDIGFKDQGFIEDEGYIDIRDIRKDPLGRIWVSSSHGVAYLENGSWTVFDKDDFELELDERAYSMGVALDHNNNIWVALLNDGLVVYDGVVWRRIEFDKIWTIYNDNLGRIWIGTNSGLFVYSGDITGLEDNEEELNFEVSNYPNPFNNTTNIQYTLNNSGHVRLEVFNVLGEKLKTLSDKYEPVGKHELLFIASDYSSGVYFIKLHFEHKYVTVSKMILME